mgnify:CR=1 FL=1
MLVCYWLVAELLFELRYSTLGLGQLALRIFLLLLQALVLCYHVFGAVSDGGEFPVDLDHGRIQRWEFNADSSFVSIPHSPNFIKGAFVLTLRGARHFCVLFNHALGQHDLMSGQKFHQLECGAELQSCCEFMRHIRDLRVGHDLVIRD